MFALIILPAHCHISSLAGNKLTGSIPASITQLSSLEYLFETISILTWFNCFQLEQFRAISWMAPFLKILGFFRIWKICQRFRLMFPFFDCLVRALFINNLTGTIPASIGSLTKLTTWYAIIEQLSYWCNLVTYSQTNSLEPSLHLLVSLKIWCICMYLNLTSYLDWDSRNLYSNQLTGTIPDSLNNLTNVTAVYATSNLFLLFDCL